MIKTYFEKETDRAGNTIDNSRYFQHTKIAESGEEYREYMGQYMVISLSLKSAKQPDFDMAYASLIDEIIKGYQRHYNALQGETLLDSNREKYQRIMCGKGEAIDYAKSLEFFSHCLKQCYGKNTIILIDEYDVPLENSCFEGFYDKMIKFIHSLFESAFKTNDSLEFTVITGCLRISKESIFTGLNKLNINSN